MTGRAVNLLPRLAATPFPERDKEAENRLDAWVLGRLLSLPMPSYLRQWRLQAFSKKVAQAASGLEAWDAGRLCAEARSAARIAYARNDLEAGSKVLAMLREVSRRTLGMTPYPPQVYGAWLMLQGHFIELDTGEGKTLTAALAACVAALSGAATHVVTVNDYLAQRDAQTMGPLYAFFGLTVGAVHSGVGQGARAAEYARHITYCTNKDLVFDYLRDQVNNRGLQSLAQKSLRKLHGAAVPTEPSRLRGLYFAIVDEADSILIDEARTPLILSSVREAGGTNQAYADLLRIAAQLERSVHFNLAGPMNAPELTPEGRRWLEQPPEGVAVDQCAEFWNVDWVREHYVVQALRAMHVLMRDQNYVVVDGKVVIVDEFTGRLLPDRTWEQGLHQLVEVKEGCAISGQNMTLARLTYQNFFARYLRLAGMSGTLREVSAELASVYHVRTVRVEPFRPSQRFVDRSMLVNSKGEKEREVAAEVRRRVDRGQAVLVGTRSVRASEDISAALTAAGIPHRVLNALQNAAEAELVAMAGQPGAVTVATNMAGRGTDIPVARSVIERSGLHVILTEWHESARIDRQLFGRCARQGDPGSCRAIVAIDDDVIQTHGALAQWLLARFSGVRMPGWAIWLLRRLVQTAAAASNAAQRRSTLLHDRQKRKQLAFSGRAE